MPRTPDQRDELADLLAHFVALLSEPVAHRVANLLTHTGCAGQGGVAPSDVPTREHLMQREAEEWTGLSESSLRRARSRGLPSEKVGGLRTYRIDDLRRLMAGEFNGDLDDGNESPSGT